LTSPRPYVAAAAASVLAALYFVPSASASPSHDAPAKAPTSQSARAGSPSAQLGGLADTGAVDTKPYLIGGAAFLAAGAGLVVNAGRRARRSEA
jgi:hypothetical protein